MDYLQLAGGERSPIPLIDEGALLHVIRIGSNRRGRRLDSIFVEQPWYGRNHEGIDLRFRGRIVDAVTEYLSG